MKFDDLKDGVTYIATDKDGMKYEGVYKANYLPGGVFFCCYPARTLSGEENDLVSFEEK